MRRIVSLLVAAVMLTATTWAADADVQEAEALAARLSQRLAEKVSFAKIKSPKKGTDVYSLVANVDGSITIGGNNANAMAVGLNHYLKKYCNTTVSWYADVPVELPEVLPNLPESQMVTSTVPQRFFLNYCTYGYTMTFWQWKDWERFIDWMALNGVNMPLAITGQEAVWMKVWTSMGMTEQECREYFTGPSFLAWHRMANVDKWCGPLPQHWLDTQVELQHKILARERALNMRPVMNAFAGHVPRRIKELYPDAKISMLSDWANFSDDERTYFLDSEDPMFDKVQKMFVEEQSKLFGSDHIYGIDPFNEMDPPSWEESYLARVTKHMYESVKKADPKAEWLQMGWILYYQKVWTAERTKA
ncbi:MAG: alpha-N-acetylglucosaminidase N-terminal domain-containing protein, partial [Bacteroidales bacterium]|nr:alpha-N-acetylglucosaminidase N-terminal domain-containing protein [Candidatus Sodaliphilus fimicaballi]